MTHLFLTLRRAALRSFRPPKKGASELLLSKNGEVVKIEDPIHVAAYRACGWVEVDEKPEAVEEKPKRVRKAKTE
jgi:hypothetical protein